MSAPVGYWSYWQTVDRDHPTYYDRRGEAVRDVRAEVAFEDGRAYAEGERRRTERTALATATGYLSDPVHGARRAALVLAGYAGAPAEVVAR